MENEIIADGGDQTANADGKSKTDSDKVDYKTYDKVLNRLKKTEEVNKTLSEQLSQLQEMKKSFESLEVEKKKKSEEELINKGEYKKLLELREQQIAELEKKAQGLQSDLSTHQRNLHDTWKAQAIQSVLPGKIKKSEYFNFIDFDQIPINPETNRPDDKAVQTAAESFLKNFPELIDTTNIKGMPSGHPQMKQSFSTVDSFKNMSYQDMRKNLKSLVQQEKNRLGMK